MVTVAFAITAPCSSCSTPVTVPVSICAHAAGTMRMSTRSNTLPMTWLFFCLARLIPVLSRSMRLTSLACALAPRPTQILPCEMDRTGTLIFASLFPQFDVILGDSVIGNVTSVPKEISATHWPVKKIVCLYSGTSHAINLAERQERNYRTTIQKQSRKHQPHDPKLPNPPHAFCSTSPPC